MPGGRRATPNVDPHKIQIPERLFLFTVDQVASMVALTESELRVKYIYFVGRSTGLPGHRMNARNIASPTDTPEWRISHREFVIWAARKGYRLTQGGEFIG